jgi:hypothetical protein
MVINMDTDNAAIKESLKAGPCWVTFTKVDGTERTMKCTLSEAYIPQAEPKKTERVKKENLDALAVWDIEKVGWRSFRYDSVLEIEPCTAG